MVDAVNDASEVLITLREALRSDPSTAGLPVKLMGLVNTDMNVAKNGWVGVYVNRATLRPRTAGAGSRNWSFAPSLKIVVQASDARSSENAYVRLEKYITDVLNVVLSNPTLRAKIDGTLMSIDVDYGAQEDDAASLHFEGAVLTLTYESRSR